MVYSVEWPDSLKKLRSFHDKILNRYSTAGNKAPVVIIAGNKIDSPNRQLTIEEGKCFSDSLGVKHHEVSAANGEGITEAYNAIIRELLSRRVVQQPKTKEVWYECCSLL